MNSLIQFKKATPIFIAAALACVALSPTARAVLPAPTPDGAYPGWNTAEGSGALFNLTTGAYNTAIGAHALYGNITGTSNTAVGAWSLAANSSGYTNVATGHGALRYNTTGAANTATGFQALYQNSIGLANVAVGIAALYANTTGGGNTAIGFVANHENTTGRGNTAVGYKALWNNTTGERNTAIGQWALQNNITGSDNIGVGPYGLNGYNVVRADHVIAIGHPGQDVSNTTWIGNINGVTTQDAVTAPVVVSADGQLGTVASSAGFKKDITTMDKASDAILSLRPVTFHYKTDTKGTPQFGLIAEEVAKVNPALVLPDKEGKPYTVRYDAVNAMLLNEFLKEHRKVEQLEKQVEGLTAGLQKVSAQLEASKPAPQVVNNP